MTQQIDLDGKLAYKNEKLTWRQLQTLLSIYWRIKTFGGVTLSDVVGDIGVAFVTAKYHLAALNKKQIILCGGNLLKIETSASTKEIAKKLMNLSFDDQLLLTEKGEQFAIVNLKRINCDVNDSLPVIFSRLKEQFENTVYSPSIGFNLNSRATFSKVYNNIIKTNLTEPIITSIALYSELDSQLNLIKNSNNDNYLSLTKNKLNLEIRSGRLSSIAIPIMLRGQMPQNELKNILGSSWSWLNTVQKYQINRYMGEAVSLGLIQQSGGILTSLKPTTTDVISWLATKTGDTFLNAMNIAPKAALLVFRESFYYPTRDDLLNPIGTNNKLSWAQEIYEGENIDRDIYTNSINEAIDILVNQTQVIDEIEGRLIPRTVMRNITKGSDIEKSFTKILKLSEKDNITAAILLSITANPGVTIDELYHLINDKNKIITYDNFVNLVNILTGKGLVHISRSAFSKTSGTTKLFAFSQIPFINSKSESPVKVAEANAFLKGNQPFILSTIKDFFPEPTERQYVCEIISKLIKDTEITFDDIEEQYGRKMSRKLGAWSFNIKAFIEIDRDYSAIKVHNSELSKMILNVLQYSLLTTNESLGMYANTISDMISRDVDLVNLIERDASILKQEFMKVS